VGALHGQTPHQSLVFSIYFFEIIPYSDNFIVGSAMWASRPTLILPNSSSLPLTQIVIKYTLFDE
jgi:hypothetical protein